MLILDLPYTILLLSISLVAYLMATEEYFFHFVILIGKIIRIKIERFYWLIRLHPIVNNNFIARWIMYRKHLEIAKKLEKELNDTSRFTD
jgi:hypothetical protein